MATNFPTSLDTFTNPTGDDSLNSDTVPHADQHANVNDAVEAIEAALLDGAPLHIDDANERVGVGNVSPSYALDVTGDINATGDLRIGGVRVGKADAYTPTLTNWTASSVTGAYIRVGKLVYVFFEASGTITCSGIMRVTVPVAAAASNRLNGHHGIMLEGGVAWYPCMTTGFSTTQFDIYALTQTGTPIRWLATSASSPFSWGASDAVSITFCYEAA